MSRVPGTFRERIEAPRRDRSQEGLVAEKLLLYAGALTAERYTMGCCTIMLAREPYGTEHRWHLSISHPSRYPSWDEIKTAVYSLEPLASVTMAQVLGPVGPGEWVNVAENCFHLLEIRDPVLLERAARPEGRAS